MDFNSGLLFMMAVVLGIMGVFNMPDSDSKNKSRWVVRETTDIQPIQEGLLVGRDIKFAYINRRTSYSDGSGKVEVWRPKITVIPGTLNGKREVPDLELFSITYFDQKGLPELRQVETK